MLVFALSDMYSYFKSCVLSQRERKMGITITRHTLRYIIIMLLWYHICIRIILITYTLLQSLLLSYNGKFSRSSNFMDRGPLPFLGLVFDDVHMHPFHRFKFVVVYYPRKLDPLKISHSMVLHTVYCTQMADLQLTEKVDKLPRCFQLRQVSTGKYHTFMVSPLKDP